ncbi:hypothetical protein P152DRAFT_3003 [Eremomyces bilateralis CBS 781.70]|uniref:Secreted protein n=1 Tax=Eremomyces bilateralis CBS 781.70 TaxID=1392243 RepID=A0A6G1GG69_9PEZI|nr:uncharacterized protein P152DRAFT_3003 [Eremomyces bilateralis CBS 781.70]KAF1816869.1 hypothetical protein P152DRAFT_3003 [Eremomyces bilateralis CBS 781.70]
MVRELAFRAVWWCLLSTLALTVVVRSRARIPCAMTPLPSDEKFCPAIGQKPPPSSTSDAESYRICQGNHAFPCLYRSLDGQFIRSSRRQGMSFQAS